MEKPLLRTRASELDTPVSAKYLADCLFFSFQYSQGQKEAQRLLFQYLAGELASQIKLPIAEEILQQAKIIAEKQIHARIGKHTTFVEEEGNSYTHPPDHASMVNAGIEYETNNEFEVMKEVLNSYSEKTRDKQSLLDELASQLIQRDLKFLTQGGRKRRAGSGADPYQSQVRDYALANKPVAGPLVYHHLFKELGTYLRGLVAEQQDKWAEVDLEDLAQREYWTNEMKNLRNKPGVKAKIQLLLLGRRHRPVSNFEWLAALNKAWEKTHPGQQFVPN